MKSPLDRPGESKRSSVRSITLSDNMSSHWVSRKALKIAVVPSSLRVGS